MFGRIFGSGKETKDSCSAEALSPALKQAILNTVGAKSIPLMPAAAQKAFQLSVDPNAEARDFVEVVESDEALSARILKIANSVYFDRGKPSQTIEESVLLIGINELRCLLSATTLSELFPSNYPARTQFWINDIATAIIGRTLARRLLPNREELVFLGGLMHDIGKLLLLQRAGDTYRGVLKLVEDSGIDFCEAEEQSFPFNHTEVGELIGERWSFSSELLDIIRRHHRSFEELAGEAPIAMAGLVKCADLIAHSLGLGHPRGFTRLRNRASEQLEAAWEFLGVPENDRKPLLASCERAFSTEHELYAGKAI